MMALTSPPPAEGFAGDAAFGGELCFWVCCPPHATAVNKNARLPATTATRFTNVSDDPCLNRLCLFNESARIMVPAQRRSLSQANAVKVEGKCWLAIERR